MAESSQGAVSGTVARTVRVLRFLAERRSTTIRDASVALKLAPSTVHRLFDLLAREGLIKQGNADRSYSVGPEFFRMAAQVVGRYDLRSIALPTMQEVVDACNETCVLVLYLPTVRKITFAERVDSPALLRYQLPMNTHLSLFSGASGRSILAFLPEDQVKQIFDSDEISSQGSKAAAWTKISKDLKAIQKRGYAISRGQMIAGAMAIAAPIIGAEGTAIAAIAVTGPNERMHRVGVQRLSALLRAKAQSLSLRLGGHPLKTSRRGKKATKRGRMSTR